MSLNVISSQGSIWSCFRPFQAWPVRGYACIHIPPVCVPLLEAECADVCVYVTRHPLQPSLPAPPCPGAHVRTPVPPHTCLACPLNSHRLASQARVTANSVAVPENTGTFQPITPRGSTPTGPPPDNPPSPGTNLGALGAHPRSACPRHRVKHPGSQSRLRLENCMVLPAAALNLSSGC